MNTPTMALGTMYFGTRVDERTAFSILDRYAELGGAFVDTSDNYSFWTSETGFGGQSEALLGRWLASNSGVRVRLSTKVGAQPTRVGGFPDHLEGLREDVVREAMAKSLERLGVDGVDLYWAHVEDPTVPVEDLVETFGGLVRAGLTARWGVSNHPSWLLERIRATAERDGHPEPVAYQERYSYFQPAGGMEVEGQPIPLGMLSPDGLDFLHRNPSFEGWVYTATLQGRYDRTDRPLEPEYHHPGTDRRLAALTRVATERGLLPGQVVLAWLASGSPALTPIVGVSTVEQLEQAVQGASTTLTKDELALLNAA
ncbi:aldo/keto reductase [Kribbella italica]|uniref:Aryl-alcohol dehydrogenase-like predicted oxidoreductase n=1 Tax=Kribbella italica TaxID=1540520 RepID=A0A7W9J683_9ACTN|nr:aldo/keto reductase [Kribbella italica]MBB5836376.1 aryl-alcohol dehydrogenase-like predicted oxidoreductase [Kribbella italica]